jgi:3-carboxy-cis,cis-muconate cycloisomerase
MSLLDPLFHSAAVDAVFSDAARIQGILDFEAALARAEARAGIIPASAARAIGSKCRAERFEIAALSQAAARAGNAAIPLVKQLTELVAKDDKDSARFVHWGATSQDAIDTGCVLQLRQALEVIDADLARVCDTLAQLADKHRATPIVARTWMQQALPTTFGFIVAGWLDAVQRHRMRLAEVRPRVLALQFGGAVGTLAALEARGPEVAAFLAEDLHLALPDLPWHSHRDRMAEVATTMGLCTGTLGKIACDIALHTQTEVAEVCEPAGEGRGGSSSMPHKRNPVTCAVVLSAAIRVPGLVSTMLAAMVQEQERGLGGWHAEWETLPEIVRLTAGALHHLAEMLPALEVDAEKMRQNLDVTRGLIFAEAVAMALGERMGRLAAHQLVETACRRARAEDRHLRDILREEKGVQGHLTEADLDSLFDTRNYLGASDSFVSRAIAANRSWALRKKASSD